MSLNTADPHHTLLSGPHLSILKHQQTSKVTCWLLPGGPCSLAFFTGRENEKTQISHKVNVLVLFLFVVPFFPLITFECNVLVFWGQVVS